MNEQDRKSLPDVDSLLNRIAAETPNLPEGFHDRWTARLRQEAGEPAGGFRPEVCTEKIETNEADPAETAETLQREKNSGKEKKQTDRNRQWRRIAGIVAVFAFLIGGTLLTRDSLRPARPVQTASVAGKQAGSGEQAETGPALLPESLDAGVRETMLPQDSLESNAAWDEAAEADMEFLAEEAEEQDASTKFPVFMNTAMPSGLPETFAAAVAADSASGAVTEGAGTEGKAVQRPETEEKAGTAAEVRRQESADPEEAEEASGMEEERPAAAAKSPDPSEGSGLKLFLEDMCRFIAAVLPYLAGAAVSFAVIIMLWKKSVNSGHGNGEQKKP